MAANGDEIAEVAARGEELWRHPSPELTPMWRFLHGVNAKHKLQLKDYHDLLKWSEDNIATFWGDVWDFVGIKASSQPTKVVDESAPMFPRPAFFIGAQLNFAQNLLFPAGVPELNASSTAIIAATETTRETVSWGELREKVLMCQRGLRALGIKPNDRIAGYVGNNTNAIVAMLATTSLGAIWTAISPDSGVQMVLDRLQQIGPRVLFVDDGQVYNGKSFGVLGKVGDLLSKLDTIEACVVFRVKGEDVGPLKKNATKAKVMEYDEFAALEQGQKELYFEQLPADHPIYILYSSGTTGAPKCIVHGAIGTLIQHKKEHILHCSVTPGSHLFYFTTCTWMMWHWLVSGLASAATIILFDGSPMRYRRESSASSDGYESYATELAMPLLIDELQINHFGTSAKYLSLLEQKGIYPKKAPADAPQDPAPCTLASLQAVYNTAAPLSPSTFRYVYAAFGPDINLGSITGGTDIISLFGAANPLVPVYAGEVQAAGLGMAMRGYDESGADVTASGAPGDLVCVRAFPCQPVAFWGAEGEAKYRKSYFERFVDADGGTSANPIWHHGDYVQFTPETKGLVMLGRSDGVLNPAGVRFGSAEIYNVLLKCFGGVVADGLCVGRKRSDGDEDVVLFVTMEPGKEFNNELAQEIRKNVRAELSARHVPKFIDQCPDIPMTVNGKKVEGAVKQIISGSKVKTSASVANADCLDFYKSWAEKN